MLLKSEIAYDHPLNIQNFDGISLIEHDLNNNLAGKIKNSSEINQEINRSIFLSS